MADAKLAGVCDDQRQGAQSMSMFMQCAQHCHMLWRSRHQQLKARLFLEPGIHLFHGAQQSASGCTWSHICSIVVLFALSKASKAMTRQGARKVKQQCRASQKECTNSRTPLTPPVCWTMPQTFFSAFCSFVRGSVLLWPVTSDNFLTLTAGLFWCNPLGQRCRSRSQHISASTIRKLCLMYPYIDSMAYPALYTQ